MGKHARTHLAQVAHLADVLRLYVRGAMRHHHLRAQLANLVHHVRSHEAVAAKDGGGDAGSLCR